MWSPKTNLLTLLACPLSRTSPSFYFCALSCFRKLRTPITMDFQRREPLFSLRGLRDLFQKRAHPSVEPSVIGPMQKVPPEIVDLIFSFLPPGDQICFALSCKSLYNLFLSLLSLHNKRPLHVVPPEKRPAIIRNIDIDQHPRPQLIRRLENDRWKYCRDCWTLHQPSALRGLKNKELTVHPTLSTCMPFADNADICPCITMTPSDALHLMEIHRKNRDLGLRVSSYYGGFLKSNAGFSITHSCTFEDHSGAKVVIETLFLKISPVAVMNSFAFAVDMEKSTEKYSYFTGINAPLPKADDRSAKKWLQKFFAEAGSSYQVRSKSITSGVSLSENEDGRTSHIVKMNLIWNFK